MTGKRHARKAALPAADYTRPASLDVTGLIVTVFGENGGTEGVCDFGRLKGSLALRRSLAAGFDKIAGPGGTWRSGATTKNGFRYAKDFLDYLSTLPNPPQSIEEVSARVWAAWRMSLPTGNGSVHAVVVMRNLLAKTPGLPPDTTEALRRRIGGYQPAKVTSYSLEELEKIRGAAARVFNGGLVRIRRNREHVRQWYAGKFPESSPDFLIGEALDCVLRTGDVPRYAVPGRVLRKPYQRLLGGTAAEKTWGRLFPTREEMFALCVLLVASEAWNRSVLDKMRVPEHDPAAGEPFDIHMVEVNKMRRPVRLRYTSNNLVDTGPDSPGRLMGRAIEATDLVRQCLELQGKPTDRLLVGRRQMAHNDGYFYYGIPRDDSRNAWPKKVGLQRTDGSPASVDLRTLRRTVQVRVRREPAQNSAETHADVYVLRDPSTVQETQKTIAQGLTKALEHARVITQMKMILGEDAEVLTELADDPELAEKLLSGKLDTVTGACMDFTHSPRGEPGEPCPDSFLECLACENAIGTRRHLPRQAYLRACLDELRSTLDPAVWELDWRSHYERLTSLLNNHSTAVEQKKELSTINDHDRTLVDDFLRRRFDP